jgi:replicative DNA helicase
MPRNTDISPLSRLVRRIDAVADGAPSPDTVPTGFPSVDRILGGGIRRGDLVVLGGDVGSGKSSLALAIALRAAAAGNDSIFLSGEMSVERVLERALAIEGRARIDDIRQGSLDDAARSGVGAAAVRLRERAPIVEPLEGEFDAVASTIEHRRGMQLAVVDSLESLVHGDGPVEEQRAATAARLKALAVKLDMAIIVTAQLPALDRARQDLRPRLHDLGGKGAIAHHADVVLGLFREEMYQPGHGVEGATELLIVKNRNGSAGYADLYFYAHWLRFEDMLDPDR